MEFDAERRVFLKTVARWVAAPVVVGTIGILASRPGETCTNQSICRTCGVSATCGLPQALTFREATKEEKD